MEMFGIVLFIPLFFLFSIFLAFTIRKRIIEKIIFIEIDENIKDLRPWDFFFNILKIEKVAKPFYYTEFFLLILDTIYILFGGYKEYLKEIEFVKEFPDFPMNPISSVLIKFAIPITLWFVILLLLLFALIMKKKENKRIYEMLDKLEKSELLKSAQADFLIPNNIIETGLLGNDIKLGSKFLFVIYPAYIIPYSWLDSVKVGVISGRYGSKAYYVNIILKKSLKSIKITFAKKEVCEKITELLLKKKYKSQNNRQSI